jgi:NADH-quinone oxidoreductase subunit M
MTLLGIPILTLIVFFPLAGVLALFLAPGRRGREVKLIANVVTGLEFLATLAILRGFDPSSGEMQLVERTDWIKAFNVQYLLGIDGISLLLVLLTSLLTFLATLSSWEAVRERLKEYYIFLLILEVGMVGVFVSLDLVLFYASGK